MKRRFTSLILSIAVLSAALLVTPVSAAVETKRTTVAAGVLHSAAVQTNGTLWTWGSNWSGELANGTLDSNRTPRAVTGNVASVSLGYWLTAIVKTDGTLWTCGENMFGQLGDGTMESRAWPVKILDNVAAAAVGNYHGAALKRDGSVWTWGSNSQGQLGNGNTESASKPVQVMDNVVAIDATSAQTAAIKSDGSLWTWGYGLGGELGTGKGENSAVPVKILEDVTAVSLGWYHGAAIKTDGSLWIWGNNKKGVALGTGKADNAYKPIKLMEDVKAVSLGKNIGAVIKTDGSLWMWGENWDGQLGNGKNQDSAVPIHVMDGVAAVALGQIHTLAVKENGELWAWGSNRSWQVGSGEGGDNDPIVNVPRYVMSGIMLDGEYAVETAASGGPAEPALRASKWALPELEQALENNLIPEGMESLDLREKVNRSEFAAIAVQLYEALTGEEVPQAQDCAFQDIAGDSYEGAIKKAYEIEITTGTSQTTYGPRSQISREQLATMLCRVIKKYDDPTWTMATDAAYPLDTAGAAKFADDGDISSWAKPSVYFMNKYGIIKGVSDTHFAPKNITAAQKEAGYASATREQAIIIAQRIFMNAEQFR